MSKAAYPLTSTPGTRTSPAVVYWAELDSRKHKYYISGKAYTYAEAASFIAQLPRRAIVFFPDLRAHVGKLIPYLMQYGELSGAGDQLKSLHFIREKETVFLSDASLYFFDPTHKLIDELNTALFDEMRVRLAPTPGNTAMRIVRRFVGDSVVWQTGEPYRTLSRSSLFGGALHWQTGEYSNVYKYDIRSAYAWSMSNIKFPSQIKMSRGLPRGSCDGFILFANVDYETDRIFSPMFVYGEDDEVYHPTQAKNVLVSLNNIDLATLSSSGLLKINNVYASLSWKASEPILAESMKQIEAVQRKYLQLSPALKVTRNAVYGKFAEADDMSTLTMKLFSAELKEKEIVDLLESDEYLFALVREHKYAPAPQHNPLFAGLITAEVRSRLYSAMDENSIYADTDGFISTKPRPDLVFDEEWGSWRPEEQGHAIVLGGRIYGIANKTKIAGQHQHVSMYQLMNGLEKEIQVAEMVTPNPMLMEKVRTVQRTLRAIKYPHVEAADGNLYITRSPTIKIKSRLPDVI